MQDRVLWFVMCDRTESVRLGYCSFLETAFPWDSLDPVCILLCLDKISGFERIWSGWLLFDIFVEYADHQFDCGAVSFLLAFVRASVRHKPSRLLSRFYRWYSQCHSAQSRCAVRLWSSSAWITTGMCVSQYSLIVISSNAFSLLHTYIPATKGSQ